ncbi:P-loop containing nucleoside triphosphate hydrolase protein [Dendryphion nanum]|uniref:P-loop containing nucleoside triphosphate hydrolase protein n=1 Tax=Dendryphion nanum TaxID=256645 RepID=A0A9P9E245_9PLEO|nr:P-loop containing nucleoside triphosphate hydrolase protein [Dendryphion nanum]
MADSNPETTNLTKQTEPPPSKYPPLRLRKIDRDDRVRKLPMRILVLGMCRTGTSSIIAALRKLDYTPHQMREILTNPSQIPLWQEALTLTLIPPSERPSHLRTRKAYNREDFDKLLGDYDVVTDVPSVVFWKQLIDAYPEAKVILTNRPYDEWEHSMQSSIWQMFTWQLFHYARVLGVTAWAPLLDLLHTVFRVHNGNNYGGPKAKKAYEEHYDNIRAYVPAGNLLELGPEQGWKPLCEFLDKPVPKESYPLMQENQAMTAQMTRSWSTMVRYLVLMVLMPGGVAIIGAAFIYWRHTIWDGLDGVLSWIEPYARLS